MKQGESGSQMTAFERRVLDAILAGKQPRSPELERQVARATVEKREIEGVGFFTTFARDPGTAPVPGCPNLAFGDPPTKIRGLQHGMGFVLFVRDGRLDMLEGYAWDEPLPAELVIDSIEPG